MILGIMQPYFFPYIGYWQLMNAVRTFIIYDNIEYTKKGWINRNRILVNCKDSYITLPIKKDSDYLNVSERYLADTWKKDRIKMLNQIKSAYQKAPEFITVFPIIEKCILFDEDNLFKFILNSILTIKSFLDIKTKIQISSLISIDHTLKSEEKVIALCKAQNAKSYINPSGGIELYNKQIFSDNEIRLYFMKAIDIKYQQFTNNFIPSLSIIDMMMFNSREQVQLYLTDFKLL